MWVGSSIFSQYPDQICSNTVNSKLILVLYYFLKCVMYQEKRIVFPYLPCEEYRSLYSMSLDKSTKMILTLLILFLFYE